MRLQIETSDQILDYVRDHTPQIPAALEELRRVTSEMPLHLMQVSPEQGNFLRTFVRSLGASRVLEVGVFTGYSLISMALGVPAGGKVTGLELNHEWARIATDYAMKAGIDDKVEIRVGPAAQQMRGMLEHENAANSFDLVFIDADKEGYATYLDLGLRMLRPGGSLLVDNVLWHGALLDSNQQDSETVALREFNDYVTTLDPRIQRSMFPYADGMTLIVKP